MFDLKALGISKAGPRSLLLTLMAVALSIALPVVMHLSSTVSHAESGDFPNLVANLQGDPIGGQTPHGFAAYFDDGTNRSLTVQASVNLADGTELAVCLNTDNIGTMTVHMHHGFLYLSTYHGGSVPTVVSGDVLTIKNGNTAVLTGTFAPPMTPSVTPTPSHTPTATHTPTPSPSGTPINFTHFFAQLTGPPIGGVIPRGFAAYVEFGQDRHIDVYVSFVNLPEGQMLPVFVSDAQIGSITLHDHQGALHLDTRHGDTVPVVINGTPITITDGTSTILSGIFSDMPPSPSPTPTHSASPTPTPFPMHSFGARLNGANEVPPVVTDGRGAGFVRLNPAETSIGVGVGYFHLSSDATAITINGPAMPNENGPVIFTLPLPTPPSTFTHAMFDVTAEQVSELRTGSWYFQIATVNNPDGEIRGQIHSINHRDDFDGDGVSDISVTRRSDTGSITWYTLKSFDGSMGTATMGMAGDINVQGDYDGDGIADLAVFTPGTGNWQILGSVTHQTLSYNWGLNGDIPVVGDYDGDGINDLAVFRPSDGNWYIRRSSDLGLTTAHWGVNGDRPISGDFDGDGLNDLAVFRPSDGNWYIKHSSDGKLVSFHWGLSSDQPVAGDFDGDGLSDMAVFRPSEGNWYIYRSSDQQATGLHFGSPGDIPVPCEFDAEGQTDIAVFRPSDGNWYILRPDQVMGAYHFGLPTDHPIATAYAP